MRHRSHRNGIAFYTKNLFQILVWLVEVIGVPVLLILTTKSIMPFNSQTTAFNFLERYLAFYAVYQILVFIFLSSVNDCKKDQTLALLKTYEYLQLYFETNDQSLGSRILCICEAQQGDSIMNNLETKKEYKNISELLTTPLLETNITKIKSRIIYLEHEYEEISLLWKYSFLVRLFK